jgi:hypothetical protein
VPQCLESDFDVLVFSSLQDKPATVRRRTVRPQSPETNYFRLERRGLHDLGFGAEEVAAIEPLLVTAMTKAKSKALIRPHYRVLVNAVKEQQEQIKQQQKVISVLNHSCAGGIVNNSL